jgi:uncharacterized protein (TIGR02246 family)
MSFSTWMSATEAGDLSQVLDLMTEDVVFLLPGQPPMRGRDAFAAAFRSALEHVRMEGTADIQEIRIAGVQAYCWKPPDNEYHCRCEGGRRSARRPCLSVFRKES